MVYNKIMETNEQVKVAESVSNVANNNTPTEKCVEAQSTQNIKGNKKPLTPYQKYKLTKSNNFKLIIESKLTPFSNNNSTTSL